VAVLDEEVLARGVEELLVERQVQERATPVQLHAVVPVRHDVCHVATVVVVHGLLVAHVPRPLTANAVVLVESAREA